VETADEAAPPTLRIVRGEPTPEELAALIAVIARRGSGGGTPPAQPKASGWTDRSRYVRSGLWHVSDGWRTSAYPQ
jgi:hypothetical protein